MCAPRWRSRNWRGRKWAVTARVRRPKERDIARALFGYRRVPHAALRSGSGRQADARERGTRTARRDRRRRRVRLLEDGLDGSRVSGIGLARIDDVAPRTSTMRPEGTSRTRWPLWRAGASTSCTERLASVRWIDRPFGGTRSRVKPRARRRHTSPRPETCGRRSSPGSSPAGCRSRCRIGSGSRSGGRARQHEAEFQGDEVDGSVERARARDIVEPSRSPVTAQTPLPRNCRKPIGHTTLWAAMVSESPLATVIVSTWVLASPPGQLLSGPGDRGVAVVDAEPEVRGDAGAVEGDGRVAGEHRLA